LQVRDDHSQNGKGLPTLNERRGKPLLDDELVMVKTGGRFLAWGYVFLISWSQRGLHEKKGRVEAEQYGHTNVALLKTKEDYRGPPLGCQHNEPSNLKRTEGRKTSENCNERKSGHAKEGSKSRIRSDFPTRDQLEKLVGAQPQRVG